MLRKVMLLGFFGVAVIFGAIQLIPYGRNHSNPPVTAEPAWDSVQTREFAVRACFDCHSNEVRWPWYSNVAPVSWLVQRDVDLGRDELNFSEWHREQEGEESAETVREGEMPLMGYVWLHPSAKLSAQERDAFIRGLEATFGATEEGGKEEQDDE